MTDPTTSLPNGNNPLLSPVIKRTPFLLSDYDLLSVSDHVTSSISAGLSRAPSPFKMLKSHLGLPSGQERGRYLALDFGGTNLRVFEVHLAGNGHYEITKTRTASLTSTLHPLRSAKDLFDYIATMLSSLAPEGHIHLGFTFSYPATQEAIDCARLIHWTKEIDISGVIGENVVQLLRDSLNRNGLAHIQPVAVINDTVGTLLTSAYQDSETTIGSICGTGHNTCYLESRSTPSLIINLESGNFDCIPSGKYDALLDRDSDQPGQQRLEKAVSGRYIGELFRLACCDLHNQERLFPGRSASFLEVKDVFEAQHLSQILAQQSMDHRPFTQYLESIAAFSVSSSDLAQMTDLARSVVNRSAQLISATFLGIIKHIDPDLIRSHTISIDGSLFLKMPYFKKSIEDFLTRQLDGKTSIKLISPTESSGVGAALAAALASKTALFP